MGLLDVINGMQNGPRGQAQPGAGASSGGMSPMTMALMGLLALKAIRSFSGTSAGASPASAGTSSGAGGSAAPSGSGGSSLSDVLSGGLGSLFGGGSAGSVLSGGLGNLIKDFQNSGHGSVAQSWIGNGPNQAISPGGVESAVGSDTIDELARHTGMDRNELLNGVSQYLPRLVDHLTPNGRLPTEAEAARMS